MARVCNRHPFLLSENLCGRCGQEFCRECLVFPRGQKLPLCVTCAVARSGVRTSRDGGLSKRAIRNRLKARQAELADATPAPLHEIENPIPAGWAMQDDDLPLDLSQLQSPSRRRYRDAPPRRTPSAPPAPERTPVPPGSHAPGVRSNREPIGAPRAADPGPGAGEAPPSLDGDSTDWLSSLYTKD
jgi:hypothetical protein